MQKTPLLYLMVLAVILIGSPKQISAQSQARGTVVMLVPVTEMGEFELIVAAVKSNFMSSEFDFFVEPVVNFKADVEFQSTIASATLDKYDATAVFWCDLPSEPEVFLYLSIRGSDDLQIRQLDNRAPEGKAEAAGIIIFSSVLEMVFETEEEGSKPPNTVLPDEMAPPPDDHIPPELPSDIKRVGINAAYAYTMVNAAHPANHGLGLRLEIVANSNWSIIAGYRFVTPVEATGQAAGIRLRSHPIFAGVRYSSLLGSFYWGARLEGFVDLLSYSNHDLAEGIEPIGDGRDVDIGLFPAVEGGIAVGPSFKIVLSIGAFISFFDKEYTARSEQSLDSNSEILLAPWTVRPTALIGIQYIAF